LKFSADGSGMVARHGAANTTWQKHLDAIFASL